MTILEELPLHFTPVMALAAAVGNKTETRRVITSANSLFDGAPAAKYAWGELHWDEAWIDPGPSPVGNPGPYLKVPRTWEWDGSGERTVHRIYPRYQVGVKLWVRENWWTAARHDRLSPSNLPPDAPIWYERNWVDADLRLELWGRKRPNIHLPRRFCGMELEVVSCQPERVQEITEQGCLAEGTGCARIQHARDPSRGPLIDGFANLWDRINLGRGYGWDTNPWVWKIRFKLLSAVDAR